MSRNTHCSLRLTIACLTTLSFSLPARSGWRSSSPLACSSWHRSFLLSIFISSARLQRASLRINLWKPERKPLAKGRGRIIGRCWHHHRIGRDARCADGRSAADRLVTTLLDHSTPKPVDDGARGNHRRLAAVLRNRPGDDGADYLCDGAPLEAAYFAHRHARACGHENTACVAAAALARQIEVTVIDW